MVDLGSRHRSLRDQVVDEVRHMIIRGELAAGSRLIEENLAQQLGVSRNPLREALQTLAAEGFVSVESRRGASVAIIDEKQSRDLLEVRESLETLAARLAAARATPEHIAHLREILATATAAERAGDDDALTEANSALHAKILECADNDYLRSVYSQMRTRLQWIFRQHVEQRRMHSTQEHVEIVEAIAAGDVERAGAAALGHVRAGTAIAPDSASR